MTDIYIEISSLSDKFRRMAFAYTKDKNKINEAVQELMLYFLQMNPETLKKIYVKDGIVGITRYGSVALRRALTSKRSNFYYKYEKYYTTLDDYSNYVTYTTDDGVRSQEKHLYNLPNQKIDNYQWTKLEQIDRVLDELNWYDRELFKLYYYESNTLDSLAAKTKISRNSLFTTIDKVRGILKKELNE
jgi:DNA-directed RNA polymerase specialized sigma24 family protein|tara:strand:- start:2299 stop:2862 length:564 start_codon:yes stop_codon:yes gene_type:complete